ncbi:MAG TPA: ATP-binding protein [Vicinamibacterales bacterium]|nr:ATP-binding protein [Vicinamibacterales bacterium]
MSTFSRREFLHLLLGLAGVVAVILTYRLGLETNATTVALSFLLVVLFVAAASRLWVAVVTSLAAMVAFNFFFLPPVGTLTVVDPQNWVALFTFLAVSLVASRLSAVARDRAAIATERSQLQLKSTLLSSLAHDLRTPLTAIRVSASNLGSTWLAEPQRTEQSEIILAEVERLQRLFQNILEMTRIDAGAIAPEREWVHPLEMVEAAQSQVEYTLREHRFQVEDGAGAAVIHVDPRLTSAALAHLLENAAQYSPPGSRITVAHHIDNERLLITVEDEGQGIASGDLPHLFERFYRGGGAPANSAGTGMGLSITKGLLAAENGEVWAENRPEGGARFSMLIPAAVRATSSSGGPAA